MPELIAVKQIHYRDPKTKKRGSIMPNERFRTEDFPMISLDEFKAMEQGKPQVARFPNDPAWVVPATVTPVTEGRSPRTDLEGPEDASASVGRSPEPDDDEDEEEQSLSRRKKRRAKKEDPDEDEQL